jgi:hypothetical protein
MSPFVRPLLVAAAVTLGFPAAAIESAPPARAVTPGAKAAFDKLKALSGAWEGKAGHGDKLGPASVRWETISAGTAVMETLFPGTDHEMRSVYFLDGGDLVLTHYCAMGNQPRMKLSPASTDRELVFDFDGGTNVNPAKDVHIHSGRIKLLGPDALEGEWTVWGGGRQTGSNRFVLQRSRS